jgi:hypothetical protein
VDAIIDWARDFYRPNILQQLQMLTEARLSSLTSLLAEEDVYSIQDYNRNVENWLQAHERSAASGEDEVETYFAKEPDEICHDNATELDRFGTAYGVVRDARRIESESFGLIITKQNFSTLMHSFDNEIKAREFSHGVLKTLGQRSLLLPSQSVLEKIEQLWTGRLSMVLDPSPAEDRIYVQLRVSYFIDHEWQQIRQLNYLAITDEALPLIQNCAGLRILPGRLGSEYILDPERTTNALIESIRHTLENRNVRQDLIAAIRRQTIYFEGFQEETKVLDDSGYMRKALVPGIQKQLDIDNLSPGIAMQALVYTTHERFRIGQIYQSQPFLITSSRVDFDTRLLWKGYSKGDRPPENSYFMSKRLIYSPVPKVRPCQIPLEQDIAIFLMDGPTREESNCSIATYMDNFELKSWVHWTVRCDRVDSALSPTGDRTNRKNYACRLEESESNFNVTKNDLNRKIKKWAYELSERA